MNAKRPIRVAYPVLGDSMGGAYFSMLELTENLPDGYERVILLHERGVLADYLDERGIPFEVIDQYGSYKKNGKRRWGLKISTFFSLVLPLARFLKDNRFDLVHTQTQAMHKTWAAAAWLARIPHIWHQRTGGRPKGMERRLTKHVICVSEFVKRDMGDAFGNTPITTLYNPFDVQRYKSVDRTTHRAALIAELGLHDDPTIIGFVANFHPRKRPKLFVEMAAQVSQTVGVPVAFVMFGADRDDYRNEVEALARELDVDIHMMGFRTPPENNLAAIDIFVGCSVGEGFGRAPIEAGLVGTPVVLSDSGNHPNLVDHQKSGFIVPVDDTKALAAAVVGALQDSLQTANQVETFKQGLESRFGIDGYLQEMDKTYKQQIKGPN